MYCPLNHKNLFTNTILFYKPQKVRGQQVFNQNVVYPTTKTSGKTTNRLPNYVHSGVSALIKKITLKALHYRVDPSTTEFTLYSRERFRFEDR